MFMQLAIAAIGIAVVVMVGYLVVGQVRAALPTFQSLHPNEYLGVSNVGTSVNVTNSSTGYPLQYVDGCLEAFNFSVTPAINTSTTILCTDTTVGAGQNSAMTTVFSGLALVAVGIIVLAAFGLVQVFQ